MRKKQEKYCIFIVYDVDMILEHSENYIIFFEYRNTYNYGCYYHNDLFYRNGVDCFAVLLKKNSRNEVQPTLHKKWESRNYQFFKTNRYKDKTNLFEISKIIPILNNMRDDILCIQELSLKSL